MSFKTPEPCRGCNQELTCYSREGLGLACAGALNVGGIEVTALLMNVRLTAFGDNY